MQRQWRVARGQVGDPLMCHNNAAQMMPGLPCCSGAQVHVHTMWGTPQGASRWVAVALALKEVRGQLNVCRVPRRLCTGWYCDLRRTAAHWV